MNVLVTGAFGNLGSLVLETLLEKGHDVTAFDVSSKINKKVSKSFSGNPNLSIVWGDIRNKALVKECVAGQNVVIHLAAVIAPFSEKTPDLAHAVNVLGTQNLIEGIQQSELQPLFIFSSSISVFGPKPNDAPLCTINDKLVPTDHYSGHKIACEQLIRQLDSPWVIMRLGAMVDARMRHSNPEQARLAFSMAADNCIEFVHPKDACTAIVNTLSRPDAHNKILLIGGGKSCQTHHLDLVKIMMASIGLEINATDFGKAPLYAHWLDTEESQRLLGFQIHTLEDFRSEAFRKFRFVRPFVRSMSPLIKKLMKLYLGT